MSIVEKSKGIVNKIEYSVAERSNNSLNLIRLIAAIQVMLYHCISHLSLPITPIPLTATLFFRGVPIFFVLSGFLIWISVGRSGSYSKYLKKRFWRIYPELWTAVITEIIVILILYNKVDFKDLLLFTFTQSTVLQFWTPDSLRGYGIGTPNGALWTICVMMQFYIVAWFFHKKLKEKKIYFWVAGFVLSIIISWLCQYLCGLFGNEIVTKLYGQTIIKYFWLFYIGMMIAEFSSIVIPALKRFWWLCLLLAAVFYMTRIDIYAGYYVFWSLFMTAGLIGFAYRFTHIDVKVDISYGIFLYHMTVVNIIVTFGWTGSWLHMIPVLMITIMLAYISTITIGRLSKNMKQKMVN